MFPVDAEPNEQNVRRAIQNGESQYVELKERITTGLELAKLVSAFGNSEGGWIIVGVREPNVFVGVDDREIGRVFDSSIRRIKPVHDITSHPVTIGSHAVRVIVVKPSQSLLVTDAGAFERQGAINVPMPAEKVRAAIAKRPDANRDDQSAADIAALTATVNDLLAKVDVANTKLDQAHDKIDHSQSWAGQGMPLLVGVAGSTLSAIIVAVGLAVWSIVLLWLSFGK